LKGEDAMPMTQQEKMKKCNADATAKALKRAMTAKHS
jgi:hypothetical protein